MKILLQSCLFSPSVGGTETATRLLAIGLQELGHEVKVVTSTEGDGPGTSGLEIHRGLPAGALLKLMRWCDVYVHSNISLRHAWPLLLCRRPWIIIHHSRIELDDGRHVLLSRLKQAVTRFATNLAVSKFMADNLRAPSVVVKNPYADDVFHPQPGVARDRELIVVGRMNEDKGFQVAIETLHRLHRRGYESIRMTLVGDGPFRGHLVQLARKRNLEGAIDFTGMMPPGDLARTLNQHKILIVPSITSETFGLVAVEGMACGCLVVGSNVGSLKETIGPCGLTFEAGNADDLANVLQHHLDHPEAMEPYLQAAPAHLGQFVRGAIIPSYAECFRRAWMRWKGESVA